MLAMYQGVHGFMFGGDLDVRELVVYLFIEIALVFAATEVSERMKRGG